MRAVGLRGVLGIQLTLAIAVANTLINPVLWVLTLLTLVVTPSPMPALFESPLVQAGTACLLGGTILQLVTTMLGCWLRGHRMIIPYVLFIPLYWVLMSLAGWKGAWQLLCGRAAYWEKTDHGLSSWSPSIAEPARDATLQPATLPTHRSLVRDVLESVSMVDAEAIDAHQTGQRISRSSGMVSTD